MQHPWDSVGQMRPDPTMRYLMRVSNRNPQPLQSKALPTEPSDTPGFYLIVQLHQLLLDGSRVMNVVLYHAQLAVVAELFDSAVKASQLVDKLVPSFDHRQLADPSSLFHHLWKKAVSCVLKKFL